MKNRFLDLVNSLSNETPAKALFESLPASKLLNCFFLYEKKAFETFARWSIYERDNSPTAKCPLVDLDFTRGKIWMDVTTDGGRIVIVPLTDVIPEYRTPLSIDLNKPLLSWTTLNVPEIFGFN